METEVFVGSLREFAKSHLGCIRRIVASRLIEVNPLLSTGGAIPEVLDSVLVSQYEKNIDILEQVQCWCTEMAPRLAGASFI